MHLLLYYAPAVRLCTCCLSMHLLLAPALAVSPCTFSRLLISALHFLRVLTIKRTQVIVNTRCIYYIRINDMIKSRWLSQMLFLGSKIIFQYFNSNTIATTWACQYEMVQQRFNFSYLDKAQKRSIILNQSHRNRSPDHWCEFVLVLHARFLLDWF